MKGLKRVTLWSGGKPVRVWHAHVARIVGHGLCEIEIEVDGEPGTVHVSGTYTIEEGAMEEPRGDDP